VGSPRTGGAPGLRSGSARACSFRAHAEPAITASASTSGARSAMNPAEGVAKELVGERLERGHDEVGARPLERGDRVAVSDGRAGEARRLRGLNACERVLDDERQARSAFADLAGEPFDAELVPFGIGFAGARILRADHVCD